MVGDVEAQQFLLQLQLFGGRIIRHRGGLGGRAAIVATGIGGPIAGHQVEQVALAAGPITGPGIGPVQDQIEIGHQLGPVGAGLEAIEGAAVDQRFEGAAVELLGGQAITEIGQGGEGSIDAALFNQQANGPLAQIANR